MSKLQLQNVKNGYIVTEPDNNPYMDKDEHMSIFSTLHDALEFMRIDMPKLIKRDKRKPSQDENPLPGGAAAYGDRKE